MVENPQHASENAPPDKAATTPPERDKLDDTQGRAASLDSVATTTPKLSAEEKAARGIPIPETSHTRDTQPLPLFNERETQTASAVPANIFLMHPSNEPILQGKSRTLPPLESRFVLLAGLPLVAVMLGLIVYTVVRWSTIIPAVRVGAAAPPDTLLNGIYWTLGTFIVSAFVIGLYVSEWTVLRKRRALEKRGGIVWGEIVTAVGERNRAGDLQVTVAYQFEQPERRRKRMLHGKAIEKRNDLKDKALPAPGTPVAVFYLNPNNYELL